MRSLISLLALYMASSSAMAASLHRRAIIRGDEYIPLGDTSIPLTPLLLVFSALGVAAICMIIVLCRLLVPSCMSRNSRIILRERERAKQDLRLCGGTGSRHTPNASPTLHAPRHHSNRPPRRVGHNSLASSSTPSDSTSHSDKRNAHGYRGTSFSLADARKYSDKSHRSSLSVLGYPLLSSNDSSSGSSSVHVGPTGMSERTQALIFAHNNEANGRAYSTRNQQNLILAQRRQLSRNSSSVGKGADLQRTRSGGYLESRIPLKPQSIDRAYSHDRLQSFAHPLHHSRRDSNLLIHEVSSSAEHSTVHDCGDSRIGSFSMANAKPLQHLSSSLSNSHSQHSSWVSPPPPLQPTRSYSPIIATAPVARNMYDDSDESTSNSECASPRIITSASAIPPSASTGLLVPTRLASYTQQQ